MQISKNWERGADLFVEILLLFADPQDSTVWFVPEAEDPLDLLHYVSFGLCFSAGGVGTTYSDIFVSPFRASDVEESSCILI